MWLIRMALRRPIAILVAVIAVALGSVLALTNMNVDNGAKPKASTEIAFWHTWTRILLKELQSHRSKVNSHVFRLAQYIHTK